MSIPDFDAAATIPNKVISPGKLAHIVLRTNNFAKMVAYYKTFLGATASYENQFLSFVSYDDEHHRVAIAMLPGTEDKVVRSCGLEHIAFTFNALNDLLLTYRQRLAHGIRPSWCINHGPTTSIYYHDPDGNMIETQVDNFETPEEATAYMMSPAFAENPLGVEFDPEELIMRVKRGEEEKGILMRADVGPRGPETLPGWMVEGRIVRGDVKV